MIVWKNPWPSSPRYCRPNKIEFMRETVALTKNVVACIEQQKEKLQPFVTVVDGKQIKINYTVVLTMVDGKVCNSLTDTSSAQRCFICLATSKEFNDIETVLKKKVDNDNLQFGLSSLHAWIRFFECLLHLSYKLEIKKWQARTDYDKQEIVSRKKAIQKDFRIKLGLLVDVPTQNYGSSNDGNTARRFFQNATVSASITGINQDLIERFHIILQVISCGFDVNVSKFEEYALTTAHKFVELYPWYYMPTTVHKILIHGSKIIESSLLPIGQMSEEAQESCNKFIKKFRLDFSRKGSREKTMQDVLNRLLITSDPVISGLRKLPVKVMKTFSPDVIKLLQSPVIDLEQVKTPTMQCADDVSDSDTDYSEDSD